MPDRFDKFVHDENIKNFTSQIETETDPVRLAMLIKLFREERAREVLGSMKKLEQPFGLRASAMSSKTPILR